MGDRQRSQTISTQLQEIAKRAELYSGTAFNNVCHLIDERFLREAYYRTSKTSAPGVDGVTAKEYAVNLDSNLSKLHERLRSNQYVAPPVERVWIEKEGGKKRPIGMPSFEDKIVQRAVLMLLEPIYNHEFYGFSHGFRAGHSPHQALRELREGCLKSHINWIADADVSGFFDSLDHNHLREFIKRRVNDGGIIRLIGKWLKAGILEGETLTYPKQGSPQGGVISPMLANIFLHYVLDEWFVKEALPRMKGKSLITRFADDFVIGFESEEDARRVMEALGKRFSLFGLDINMEKTKLVKFSKPSGPNRKSETFDFLGFTHYWAKSRKGYWVIMRKTIGKRLARFVKATWQWCRKNRHKPIKEQHKTLCSKLRGYYQYYGVRCNYKAIDVAYNEALHAWRYWLSRRSHKGLINLDKFAASIIGKCPLAKPRIIHRNV